MSFLTRWVIIVVLIAVFVFGLFFIVLNEALVPLDLFFIQFEPQWLAVWVILAFGLGGLVGMLVSMSAVLRLKRNELTAKRKLASANKALDKLRAVGADA
ncbi:MAG: putative membrane protein [Pseudohongiellaceae bacterium]